MKKKRSKSKSIESRDTSSIEICLGRLWVHRNQGARYQEIPLYQMGMKDDLHGELYFKIRGQVVPGMGYKAYGQAARDGACLIEWCMYLNEILQALLESENASYHFREFDLGGFSCEFVRDQDLVLFSIDGVWGAEPNWVAAEFLFEDLLKQYLAFQEKLLNTIESYHPDARSIWQNRFIRI